MTKQQRLIEVLTTDRKFDVAEFNGRFLNCRIHIKSGSKIKKQRCSLIFDDPAELDGPRVLFSTCKGAYSESYARDAFFEALRIGQGEDEALEFANECRRTGMPIGASQAWVDANADRLQPIAD